MNCGTVCYFLVRKTCLLEMLLTNFTGGELLFRFGIEDVNVEVTYWSQFRTAIVFCLLTFTLSSNEAVRPPLARSVNRILCSGQTSRRLFPLPMVVNSLMHWHNAIFNRLHTRGYARQIYHPFTHPQGFCSRAWSPVGCRKTATKKSAECAGEFRAATHLPLVSILCFLAT